MSVARAKAITMPCCKGQQVWLCARGHEIGPIVFSGVPCLSCRRTYSFASDEDRALHWRRVESCWPVENWPDGDEPAVWWAHSVGSKRRKRGLGSR